MPPSNFWQNEKLVFRKGRVLWLDGKGQLISKGLFGILNSSKKQTKKFDFITGMIPQVDLFSFVFWKILKTPKRHFKIN